MLRTYWHSPRQGLASWFLSLPRISEIACVSSPSTKSHSTSSFKQNRKATRFVLGSWCWDWKCLTFMRLSHAKSQTVKARQPEAVMKGQQRKIKAREKHWYEAQPVEGYTIWPRFMDTWTWMGLSASPAFRSMKASLHSSWVKIALCCS